MSDDSPSLSTATWIDSAMLVQTEVEEKPAVVFAGGHRYDDLGLLAKGGMGQVRRVHDRLLGRPAVMKIMHARLAKRPKARKRFLDEIRITARLQHPGIAPVQEAGEFVDHRLWFVMKEVAGRTLHSITTELHRGIAYGVDETADGWTLRRLVEVLRRVAQTVAYAHGKGIIHRDLKPENLMVGAFGEVMVMDWGIAYDRTQGLDHDVITGFDDDETGVVGTPSYMAPEQARGEVPTSATDVYALGGVLYHLLAGVRPLDTGGNRRAVITDRPRPLKEAAPADHPPPEALAALCESALAYDPAERLQSAALFAEALRRWLDGEAARERARELVERTREQVPRATALMAEADDLDARSRALLASVAPNAPIADKRPGWTLADDAAERRRDARRTALAVAQTLRQALEADPTYGEARELLGQHYRTQVLEAEGRGQTEAALDAAEALRLHDEAGQAEWLRGDGALTLITDPPGASATLYRYTLIDRRLEPVEVGPLPKTPIVGHPIPRGSYAVELRAPGHAPVTYPIHITRGHHWDGVPPEGTAPRPIRLPRADELGPGDCYVPAGWTTVGGDDEALDPLPQQRIWVDGFVMQRDPVTHAAYIEFLNALVEAGRGDEARHLAPEGGDGTSLYRVDDKGRYAVQHAIGIDWRPDMPVMNITWSSADAFIRWSSDTIARPWRMPEEIEWEKAARGVDGRYFPMGDHLDPAWACVLTSVAGRPRPEPVTAFGGDLSPYGIHGLAGNAQDYCQTTYRPGDDTYRIVRGGFFVCPASQARSANRFAKRPDARSPSAGIRLVRML